MFDLLDYDVIGLINTIFTDCLYEYETKIFLIVLNPQLYYPSSFKIRKSNLNYSLFQNSKLWFNCINVLFKFWLRWFYTNSIFLMLKNISVWYCHLLIRKSNSRKILPLVPTFDTLSFFSLEKIFLCKGYNPLQLLSNN